MEGKPTGVGAGCSVRSVSRHFRGHKHRLRAAFAKTKLLKTSDWICELKPQTTDQSAGDDEETHLIAIRSSPKEPRSDQLVQRFINHFLQVVPRRLDHVAAFKPLEKMRINSWRSYRCVGAPRASQFAGWWPCVGYVIAPPPTDATSEHRRILTLDSCP